MKIGIIIIIIIIVSLENVFFYETAIKINLAIIIFL